MKPARRRDASALLNLAVSVQQASISASQRAEHSARSQTVSWEQELHRGASCLWWQRGKGQLSKLGEERGLPGGIWACRKTEGAGRPHSAKQEQADLTAAVVHSASSFCRIGGKSQLRVIPFVLCSLYFHFPLGRPLLAKFSFWVPLDTATVKGKELLGCLQTAVSQKMSEGKKDRML